MKNHRIQNFVMSSFLATILLTGTGMSVHRIHKGDYSAPAEILIIHEDDEETSGYICPGGSISVVNTHTGEMGCEKIDLSESGISLSSVKLYDYYGCRMDNHLVIEEDGIRCVKNNLTDYVGNPVIINRCPSYYVSDGITCFNENTGDAIQTEVEYLCPDNYALSYMDKEFKCIGPKRR